MSDRDSIHELDRLLMDLVDGKLTTEQRVRLMALLRNDPVALARCADYLLVDSQLAWEQSLAALEPAGAAWAVDRLADAGVPGSVGGAARARGLVARWRGRAPLLALVATFVALGLVVVSWSRGRREAAPAVGRPLPKVDAASGLAVVVRTEGVHWEMEDGRRPKEGEVLPPGRLRIRSGRATLSMLSGVMVVVEGPADVELISTDRVFCHQGKLRARVPEGAEGFLVSGPGSAVIDLGTEFGVNIKTDGKSRGKVFKGEVEAALLGTSGSIRRSRLMREESDAFEIDPGTGRIEPLAGPEAFVTPSDLAVPALILHPSYPSAVLKSRPRCYWRFESAAGGAIPDEIPGRPPLRVHGPIRLADTSPHNRCAVFKPGESEQYLEMEGLWKPERRPGYAIEVWFLSETIAHAALACLIAPRDTTHHLSLVELTSSNRRTVFLFPPASVRFLYRWPAGRNGGDNMFSEDIYVPYRWHHVVSQVNGDRMELYLDGVSQPTQSLDPGSSTVPCQFLLGRLSTLTESPLHPTGYKRPFVGLMDEVALYDHPLSAEEVRRHSQLAIPAARP